MLIAPTCVSIKGNSVWYPVTFTARPLYSKPSLTNRSPNGDKPSVIEDLDELDGFPSTIVSFITTLTVLVLESGTLPAASAGAV